MNGQRIFRAVGPWLLFLALIGVWEFCVVQFKVSQMVLPPPSDIFTSLVGGFRNNIFQKHLLTTGKEVVFGYVLGVSFGILVGAPIALSRTFETLFYPYLLALQTMPKVALAPLMMIWVGFGIESKIIITMIKEAPRCSRLTRRSSAWRAYPGRSLIDSRIAPSRWTRSPAWPRMAAINWAAPATGGSSALAGVTRSRNGKFPRIDPSAGKRRRR